MASNLILIIGGARSGKSRFAQGLALKLGGPVLFVATAEAGDEEMRQRIEEHRKQRPGTWRTLEVTTHVGGSIEQEIDGAQVVIVDCITLLVSNIIREPINVPLIQQQLASEIDELLRCISNHTARFIIVTNEVGLGLVPANRVGRLYRDLLGHVNQTLARQAGEIYIMMAGIPLRVCPAIQ